MQTKICTKCKVEKPVTDFTKSTRDGYRSSCKLCHRDEKQKWRHKYIEEHGESPTARYSREHREDQKEWKKRRQAEMHLKVDTIKESTPCADCGQKFPAVCMDFDHLPGFAKTAGIARMITDGVTWKKIEQEMRKCEIVCSNCHRIRTHLLRPRPWYDRSSW